MTTAAMPTAPQTADIHRGVSATVGDPSRETAARFWCPGPKLVRSIRDYQRHTSSPGPLSPLLRRLAVLRHRFWSVVSGADIPLNSKIGIGLLMVHPNGIVVSPGAEIGVNCLLLQQVTLGTGGKLPGLPILEGHVDVGAGAKILGGVRIGQHAKIGANAVVLCDVPPGATAVGVPARIIERG